MTLACYITVSFQIWRLVGQTNCGNLVAQFHWAIQLKESYIVFQVPHAKILMYVQ